VIDEAFTAGGGTVRVAAGTYKPLYAPSPSTTGARIADADLATNGLTAQDKTFILREGVKILGGYPAAGGDDTARDWAANPVILSGDLDDNDGAFIKTDNAYHVVLGVNIAANSGTVLDGVTIKGGYANGSGSITVSVPVSVSVDRYYGGGVYNANSSPVLTNVVIKENSASTSTSVGGGMVNMYSSPVLTNVAITGNSANYGGGVHNYESSPVLTNVVITGNNATVQGGGMRNSFFSSPVLTNVTIAGNSASAGDGIYNENSSPKVRNSIIWGNSSGIDGLSGEIFFSIVQGGWTGVGDYNRSDPPQFVLSATASAPTATGDYRLQSTSPAINAGSNTYYGTGLTPDLSAVATDLDGTDRIKGGIIDMGAYEKQ
jgi:hypothetical protein